MAPRDFEPHVALVERIDGEAGELCFGRRLARTELDGVHPTRGLISTRSQCAPGGCKPARLDDAFTEPDVAVVDCTPPGHLGALESSILEEVVLYFPHHIEAQLVGQLDLLECILMSCSSLPSSHGRGSCARIRCRTHSAATSPSII